MTTGTTLVKSQEETKVEAWGNHQVAVDHKQTTYCLSKTNLVQMPTWIDSIQAILVQEALEARTLQWLTLAMRRKERSPKNRKMGILHRMRISYIRRRWLSKMDRRRIRMKRLWVILEERYVERQHILKFCSSTWTRNRISAAAEQAWKSHPTWTAIVTRVDHGVTGTMGIGTTSHRDCQAYQRRCRCLKRCLFKW